MAVRPSWQYKEKRKKTQNGWACLIKKITGHAGSKKDTLLETQCNEALQYLYTPLVRSILRKFIERKKFTIRSIDSYQEELLQAGQTALWIALKPFDPSKGVLFSTYAYKVIKNEMAREIFQNLGVPREVFKKFDKIKEKMEKAKQSDEENPDLTLTKDDLETLALYALINPDSIEQVTDENGYFINEKKEKPDQQENESISKVDLKYLFSILHRAGLTEEEIRIIYLHKMKGLTHQEIGELLGMTESAVRTAYHRAKKKLKKFFDDDEKE